MLASSDTILIFSNFGFRYDKKRSIIIVFSSYLVRNQFIHKPRTACHIKISNNINKKEEFPGELHS
jgi:hypothetical protein